MLGFNVTYEIITPDSAENGEAEEMGFTAENLSLTDALASIGSFQRQWHGLGANGVEANDSDHDSARWITFLSTDECWQTSAATNKSIHFPDSLTPSTRRRICRLVGCYGSH